MADDVAKTTSNIGASFDPDSFLPRAGVPTPVPEWKRGPLAEGVLPAGDPAAPAADA